MQCTAYTPTAAAAAAADWLLQLRCDAVCRLQTAIRFLTRKHDRFKVDEVAISHASVDCTADDRKLAHLQSSVCFDVVVSLIALIPFIININIIVVVVVIVVVAWAGSGTVRDGMPYRYFINWSAPNPAIFSLRNIIPVCRGTCVLSQGASFSTQIAAENV